tara:strand:+ start:489 stop:809 length:321 start_codon:yes stop_codon:yes gene_type:complete
MIYLFLYIIALILIFYTYKVGWVESFKTVISVIVPSFLIILFNLKAGRLLFKSPIIGIVSALPTAIFIYRGSIPLVKIINNWIDSKTHNTDKYSDVIDTDSIPVDE